MNLYKEQILKHSLKGQRRAHHKYLYIDENGRYVYPEDVKNTAKNVANATATAAGTIAKKGLSDLKDKASNTINEKKQLLKDKKYVRDSKQKKSDSHETLVSKHPYAKQIQQLTSAHQTSTKRTGNGLYDYGKYGLGLYDSVERKEAPSVEKQKQKTKARATEKRTEAGVEAARARKEKKDIDSKYGREALIKSALDRGERDFREKRYAIAQEYDHMDRTEKAIKKQAQKRFAAKQKYASEQAENERRKAAPTLSKEYRDTRGWAPSIEEQIEKTRKRKKVKYVKSLYNH